jgi:hypothetical protein
MSISWSSRGYSASIGMLILKYLSLTLVMYEGEILETHILSARSTYEFDSVVCYVLWTHVLRSPLWLTGRWSLFLWSQVSSILEIC